jgi:4-carboxymuconolactone decarboxylase
MTSPHEPRLAPLPFAEWDDNTRTVLLQYLRRPELYLSGAPDAPPMPVVLEILARHVPLSDSWLPFTEMLAGGEATLSAEHRELLILRVAWRTRSGYEWAQHSRMGADAGLTRPKFDAIPQGPPAAVWTPLERTLLTAVDEMVDEHCVSDETWGGLVTSFAPAQILELLFVVGGYLCLAAVLNSLGLQAAMPPPQGDSVTPGEDAAT